ncbi:MAG: hypothetical protein Q3979_09215 [Actinomycetaceae bacterium]|nr:hypothetical protein [Actinomycetaceae bacterium]
MSVDLDYAGDVTITYPQAEAGDTWTVDAGPDGTLTDERGRQYPYLFWEGASSREYSQDEGFVVAGSEAVPFLEEKLAVLGLTDREAAEFVTYWAPRLADNEYNLVTFATEQYSTDARYTFTDASGRQFRPDTFIRLYMVHSPAEASTKVSEQVLEPAPQREGFVAVEWGGTTQEAR